MKKFLFLVFVFLFSFNPSFADYMPAYTNSILHFGIGAVSVRGNITVYPDNNTDSKPLAIFQIDKNYFDCKKQGVKKCLADDSFVAYVCEKETALFSVEYDADEWYYICYDQSRKLFGWIKKSESIDFIPWENLIDTYGRKYGLYLFRNVDDKYKKLYPAPNEIKPALDDFYYPKHIALWLISGDWILVKLTGYDNVTKTGWMRWRLDNKGLIVFPKFK